MEENQKKLDSLHSNEENKIIIEKESDSFIIKKYNFINDKFIVSLSDDKKKDFPK